MHIHAAASVGLVDDGGLDKLLALQYKDSSWEGSFHLKLPVLRHLAGLITAIAIQVLQALERTYNREDCVDSTAWMRKTSIFPVGFGLINADIQPAATI